MARPSEGPVGIVLPDAIATDRPVPLPTDACTARVKVQIVPSQDCVALPHLPAEIRSMIASEVFLYVSCAKHVMARGDEKQKDPNGERDWRLLTRHRMACRAFAADGYVPLLVHHAPANVYMQYHLATSGILAESPAMTLWRGIHGVVVAFRCKWRGPELPICRYACRFFQCPCPDKTGKRHGVSPRHAPTELARPVPHPGGHGTESVGTRRYCGRSCGRSRPST